MYLTITSRPNIYYETNMVVQYNSKPRQNHWFCVKRIFRYLNNIINDSLFYDGNGSLEVNGFLDANCIGDPINGQSKSKYVFILSNGPIHEIVLNKRLLHNLVLK